MTTGKRSCLAPEGLSAAEPGGLDAAGAVGASTRFHQFVAASSIPHHSSWSRIELTSLSGTRAGECGAGPVSCSGLRSGMRAGGGFGSGIQEAGGGGERDSVCVCV